MATQKKADTKAKDITVSKTITDPSLINIADDHSFTLEPGHYAVDINIQASGLRSRTRILDITEPTDPITVEMSTSYKLIGDINAREGQRFLIQYHNNRQWNPVQTLPADDYTVTLTLK